MKKYFVTPDVFRGGWVSGLNQKRHFEILHEKLGVDVALNKIRIPENASFFITMSMLVEVILGNLAYHFLSFFCL